MTEEIEKIVENLDAKVRKDLETAGRDLLRLGVTDIREADVADSYSKSPTATPTPVQPQGVIER
jgi:hypothetical protein